MVRDMIYEVTNEHHIYVKVTDKDIEDAIKCDIPLKDEIICAMGFTKRKEYIPFLAKGLFENSYFRRINSAISILNIDGKAGLHKLKMREREISADDFDEEISEKAYLKAIIILAEQGVKGIEEYFFSNTGESRVKEYILYCYNKGYSFIKADVICIIKLIQAFAEQKIDWIMNVSQIEIAEEIIAGLANLIFAEEQIGVFKNMNTEEIDLLDIMIQSVCNSTNNMDVKELIADITLFLPERTAIKTLSLISGKVRGDAKKSYKKALKYWNIEENIL